MLCFWSLRVIAPKPLGSDEFYSCSSVGKRLFIVTWCLVLGKYTENVLSAQGSVRLSVPP